MPAALAPALIVRFTIFAGYVAWRAVQRQIEAEGRADALAELQMWERTRAELFTELHGLNSAKEAIGPMCEILNLARVRERQRQAPPRSEAWRGSDARSGLGFVRA